jgi:hypothetical protein
MEGAQYYRNMAPMNPQLANAEHNLFSQFLTSNPIMNATGVPQAITLTAPAGYAAAKLGAQSLPTWTHPYLPSWFTNTFINATSPSWEQVWSGMQPTFRR